MFKMAGLWLTVTVLILIQNVFADICDNELNIQSCDECIRCGNKWCPQRKEDQCTFSPPDDFCSTSIEPLTMIDSVNNEGDLVDPKFNAKTIFIGHTDSVPFTYQSTVSSVLPEVSILNSTQNSTNIQDYVQTYTEGDSCDEEKCTIFIKIKVSSGFCSSNSTTDEYIYVHVKVPELNEEAIFKYHVSCACECSRKVERKSSMCHGRGDYACGACSCYKGWTGRNCKEQVQQTTNLSVSYKIFEFMAPECNNKGDLVYGRCRCYIGWSGETCSVKKCERSRGDVQCTHSIKYDVTCSGNGICDEDCQSCFCYHDRTGSLYFDWNNYCSDICMDTSGCDSCLTSNALGSCHHPHTAECAHNITVYQYNETMAHELDRHHRVLWVSCNETFTLANNDSCFVRYVARKTMDGHIAVMIVESCNTVVNAGMGSAIGAKAPLIVGILLAVAAVAVVGGLVLWRYLSAVPPLPLADPHYQNIDAEDCTGENPLYKPPTSNYKNPMFGKL